MAQQPKVRHTKADNLRSALSHSHNVARRYTHACSCARQTDKTRQTDSNLIL